MSFEDLAQTGFDTHTYLDAQMNRFESRLIDGPNIIEFGGKPFGDYHAARVLPGYEVDIKATILRELQQQLGGTTIAIAVHGQDILHAPDGRRVAQRIRGDSGLTYDEEVKRIVEEAETSFGISISAAAVTAVPDQLSSQNKDYLEAYLDSLRPHFDAIHVLPSHQGYPFLEAHEVVEKLTGRPSITTTPESLIIVSPGGGSGKFGVAVSEIAHKLQAGAAPNFIKFETFPVFGLSPTHPLNVAFMAATADLPNELCTVGDSEKVLTNYDKDVENLQLLKTLLSRFPDAPTPLHDYQLPTDMGVNVIEMGITDDTVIAMACREEVLRRVSRYHREMQIGSETSETVERTHRLLGSFATQ